MLETGQTTRPVVLSTIQLPIQPASSSATDASAKYHHVLPSRAINPRMDLVAVLSRDVGVPSSSVAGGAGTAATTMSAGSVLAPPPPGMSAAANQARMRMMMLARQRALAAGGKSAPMAGAQGEVPKVTRSASLRLSLWRMASMAGELGARVWDVEVKPPSLFADAGKDVKELEDTNISAMIWSPDGQLVAVTVHVSRRRVGEGSRAAFSRQARFLLFYAVEDGKQHRVIRIPSDGPAQAAESLNGIEWVTLNARRSRDTVVSVFGSAEMRPSIDGSLSAQPGSAEDLLKRMPSLAHLTSHLEGGEGKGTRQRQRALHFMRSAGQRQGELDLRADEVMLSESNDWAISLLDHPRSVAVPALGGKDKEEGGVQVLCAWDKHRLHLFLDASLYLGSIASDDDILTANFVTQDGSFALCTRPSGSMVVSLQRIATHLDVQSQSFSSMLHLQTLSTHAFALLTYCYDGLVQSRNLYRTTHINCITPWIQKGRSVSRKYSTDAQTEMQMLLLTTYANEAVTSILTGNETMTDGDLSKMSSEIAIAWRKLEALIEAMLQAVQRASIVFQELKGCWLWRERFGTFLGQDQGPAVDAVLALLAASQQQCFTLLRRIQQETHCWAHFYRWWKYERVRQEVIRDQMVEPRMEASYDVLLLAEFLRRGFVNYALERTIGIVFDSKTRGTYLEDDDDDEDESEESRETEVKAEESSTVDETPSPSAETAKPSDHGSWHTRPTFESHLASVQETLQCMPTGQEGGDDRTPSVEDVACLASADLIHTGPAKGLSARASSQSESRAGLQSTVKDMIELSSRLFWHAFARYAVHSLPVTVLEVAMPRSLVPFRPDALQSTAVASGGAQDDPRVTQLVKSCFNELVGQQLLLCIGQASDDGQKVLEIIAHDCWGGGRVRVAHVECDGHILDAGFYSASEIVVLHCEGEVTRLTSMRMDQLDFTATQAPPRLVTPQRRYEMVSREDGNGATQLALNHAKDVAATLDGEGKLVYWDLVLIAGEHDEDAEMAT